MVSGWCISGAMIVSFPTAIPIQEVTPTTKTSKNKNLDNLVFAEQKENNIEQNPSKVPEDGNDFVKQSLWTESEKRAYNCFLLSWARWEVDYTHSIVRSTKCEG